MTLLLFPMKEFHQVNDSSFGCSDFTVIYVVCVFPSEIYIYAGAYTQNGSLVAEHTTTSVNANSSGTIKLHFDGTFDDTVTGTIRQFFFELHFKTKVNGHLHDVEDPYGYSNKFVTVRDGLCDQVDDVDIDHGTVSMWWNFFKVYCCGIWVDKGL